MNGLTGDLAHRWIEGFEALFAAHADELGDLDRRAGDGDFADNIASALAKGRRIIDDEAPTSYRAAFTAVARGFLDTGGTSGPLFGMFFRSIAKASNGDEPASGADFAARVADGLGQIKQRGGARVGDCTLVDALEPASIALSAAADSRSGIERMLGESARAAQEGSDSTVPLLALRGRASYVGEHARGSRDPGAELVALFFRAGAVAVGDG